ncbi:MAG: hypothetical protein K5919_00070 [Clostridiales bacterium]|nr:hypothetical protein [Clostridiales bacterium]
METALHLSHNGWTEEETQRLWQEIEAASQTGAPLRGVFERMGQALGRKPNSVRNYYYMRLRAQGDEALRRAQPFETFTDGEIHDLLRSILSARARGQSVRSCVTALAGGDRTKMLRYQNKYRSILRKKPGLIARVCEEMQAEGLPCPPPPVTVTVRPLSPEKDAPLPAVDPDVSQILRSLSSLAERAMKEADPESDRLKVQRDLLLMQMEDLQLAARAMVDRCKDFLGRGAQEQAQALPQFCQDLAERAARLESLSG